MVNNNDTITLPRNVVEQALEALTNCTSEYGHRCNRCDSEVDPNGNISSALRAALDRSNHQSVHENELMMNDASYRRKFEQPQVEQEPVAWLHADGKHQPLYTHPQPKREPLTDEQIDAIMTPLTRGVPYSWRAFARAIEQAHNIK